MMDLLNFNRVLTKNGFLSFALDDHVIDCCDIRIREVYTWTDLISFTLEEDLGYFNSVVDCLSCVSILDHQRNVKLGRTREHIDGKVHLRLILVLLEVYT